MQKSDFLKPKFIKWSILTLSFGALLYLALSLYSGKENLGKAISSFPLKTYLPIILALVLLGWFLRGLRWHYYLRKQGIKDISFKRSLHIFFASFVLTMTPGKAGELVKSIFLKKEHDVPVFRTAGILLTERLMDLIGVLILALGFLFLGLEHLWLFLIAFSLVFICLVVIASESIYKRILKFLGKFKFLKWITEKVLELLLSSKQLLKPKTIVISLILSVIAWGCEGIAFFLVLQGFGLPVSVFGALFIYSIATIAGALSMLPGGIGGTEGVMIGLLSLEGVLAVNAIPAVLLIRLSTLWFIPVLGLFFMLGLLTKKEK